jgi:hypothetical protein
MDDVDLTCRDGAPRPNWDTGTDAGSTSYEKGTNNLKRYKTVATFDAGTGTSKIEFTLKGKMLTPPDPPWERDKVISWTRLLRAIGLG